VRARKKEKNKRKKRGRGEWLRAILLFFMVSEN
jgi:hypothetical protein